MSGTGNRIRSVTSAAQSILIVLAFSITGALLEHWIGFPGKAVFAGVVVFSAIAISIIYSRQKEYLRRELRAMSPEERQEYAAACRKEGIADPFEDLNEAGLSWIGNTIDVVLAASAALGPHGSTTSSKVSRGL